MTVQSLTDAMKDFPDPVSNEVWRVINQAMIKCRGASLPDDEFLPLINRLSGIVREPQKAGLDILALFVAPDPTPQMFFDNVQRLASKWSSPIDGNMATLTDAITARDKITWNKDCWGDVNCLIVAKNFEDAIEMARLYEEQRESRNIGV